MRNEKDVLRGLQTSVDLLLVYLWSQLPTRLAKQDYHWREFHELGWPPMNGK